MVAREASRRSGALRFGTRLAEPWHGGASSFRTPGVTGGYGAGSRSRGMAVTRVAGCRSFTAGCCDALDERFLGEEEEDDHWDREDGRRRHELRVETAVVGNELLQAVAQRVLGGVVHVKQRAQKVVPGSDELEQGAGGEGGLGKRNDEAAEDGPFGRSVQARRLLHLVWNRFEELGE